MGAETQDAIRDLLALRLKATATLHTQAAAVLNEPSQAALRKIFLDAASVMVEAANELTKEKRRA